MPSTYIRVALIAASLGLDTFAVSVGIGTAKLNAAARLRVVFAFATAETVMTFFGTLVGRGVQSVVGGVASYAGFAALVAIGAYMIFETLRESEAGFDLTRGWGLFVASLSISLDALGIGFSIAYLGVPLGLMFAAIAVASGSAAAIGLFLGRFFGAKAERSAGVVAGVLLMLTGLAFGALHYAKIGLD
jgi:putative Mn2+ efflux pump MntP